MADFASTDDVAARLGRALTEGETTNATAVLAGVAGLIRSEAGKAADWDPDPIPAYLRELSIEKAIAALVNPSNLASESEALGAYSSARTYQRAQDGGITLSDDEGRAVRFAVFGTNAASARQHSFVDTELDLLDDGEIDDSVGS